MAGFIRHTQNTLCQKACVHNGGVLRGASAVMLRSHPSIFGLGESDRSRSEDIQDKMLLAASVSTENLASDARIKQVFTSGCRKALFVTLLR